MSSCCLTVYKRRLLLASDCLSLVWRERMRASLEWSSRVCRAESLERKREDCWWTVSRLMNLGGEEWEGERGGEDCSF